MVSVLPKELKYKVEKLKYKKLEVMQPRIITRGVGALKEFLGGDVSLGPWNPWPIPELVQLNFATLY